MNDTFAAASETTVPLAQVVLDVTGASFADFAMTGLLRRLYEQTMAVGASFVLHGASTELAALVASCGLASTSS